MWAPVDFYTKAKTSVPVLLYTTEQICVAQFFVQLFRRWHARIAEKEDVEGDGDVRSRQDEVEMGMTQRPVESHGGVVRDQP
jgi:sodium/bile acid cotransporter 7